MPETPETNKQTDRRWTFDLLRIAASFAVIVLHVSSDGWSGTEILSPEWHTFNVFGSIAWWAVPVFVMVSGALFLGGDRPIKRIWRKNIFRIVLAFFAWSAVYALAERTPGTPLIMMLRAILRGKSHMWFLPMIACLYMAVPVLRKIVESESVMKYFLFLSFLFAFVIPQAVSCLSLISDTWGTFAGQWIGIASFHFPMGYTGYFILGYYLDKIEIGKRAERWIYLLGACGFLFTIAATAAVSGRLQRMVEDFYSVHTVNILLESIAVFVWFKNHRIPENPLFRKFVGRMSKYSFGAYLAHMLVLDWLARNGIRMLLFHPLFSVPSISILVFALSYILSAGLNHVPLVKKYFV